LDIKPFTRGFNQPQSAHFLDRGIEIGGMVAHVKRMDNDLSQLKRNRAKVFTIAAGLFLLGSQGPDFDDLFDDHHGERRAPVAISHEHAAERAADFAERAAMWAERAADAAERASAAR
jgi:hypothetical protein